MKKNNKIKLLWYAHPRIAIALFLVMLNLLVIFLFTGIICIITKNHFLSELSYIFAFTMSADGIYDFINSNDDLSCFILKLALAFIQMVIFSGAFIGFTTDVLQTTIDKRISNGGKLSLKDHYVFLNWSSIGPRILYDLSFLDGKKNVVILCDTDRQAVLDSIANIFSENKRKMKNIRVFVKEGNPMAVKPLMDISIDQAKYVGVLLSNIQSETDYDISASDLNAIKNVFTMMNMTLHANIVVEVEGIKTQERIEQLLDNINPNLKRNIVVFSHDSVIGHIMGRTLVNPTYNSVYHQLLSYDGAEFYGISPMPLEDALLQYNDCIPIINYDDDDLVDENGEKLVDQLYILSDNESTLGIRKEPCSYYQKIPFKDKQIETGFTVFIVSAEGESDFVSSELNRYSKHTGVPVSYKIYTYNDSIDTIKHDIENTQGDKKLLLLSPNSQDDNYEDTELFMTALDLKLSNSIGKNVTIYAEIQNPKNINALQNLGVVSVIVSNQIVSLFMIQVLTHPNSKKFYIDLISANIDENDAIDINIVKAGDIIDFEEESIKFSCQSELVQSFYFSSNKTKMCIGIKSFGTDDSIRFLCDKMDEPENLVIHKNDELVIIEY